jgi:hypothetical protein
MLQRLAGDISRSTGRAALTLQVCRKPVSEYWTKYVVLCAATEGVEGVGDDFYAERLTSTKTAL